MSGVHGLRPLTVVVVPTVLALGLSAPAADDLEYPGSAPAVFEAFGVEEITIGVPPGVNPATKILAIVEATLVLREDDTAPGVSGTVSSLNSPFVNGVGEPGFTGNAGENFVWSGDGVIWVGLDVDFCFLFADGFESGDTSEWSTTSP